MFTAPATHCPTTSPTSVHASVRARGDRALSIRALAIFQAKRSPALPDLPTAEEQGTKDLIAYTWNAIFLPKGAPDAVVKKLNAAMLDAMHSPAVKDKLSGLGGFPDLTAEEIDNATRVVAVAGVDPFLKWLSAIAIVFWAFALVGLAAGLGARYPRFAADNASQIAGSYGGVAFMILAVLFIIVNIVLLGWPSSVYQLAQFRSRPLTSGQEWFIAAMFTSAAAVSIATCLLGMRTGVRALLEMNVHAALGMAIYTGRLDLAELAAMTAR